MLHIKASNYLLKKCNTKFYETVKNIFRLKNHQKNKKHKENLTKLQLEMHEDVECEPLTGIDFY